jgi:hypothetical protein
MGFLGIPTLQGFRELTLSAIVLQVLLTKATADVALSLKTPGLGKVLTDRPNALLLLFLVAMALVYELYLSLLFSYFF